MNVAPIIDPVGAVVCAADVSNVKTVLVDGEILKEDFRLKASLDAPRKAVEASRDYLLAKFGDPEPGWISRPDPSPPAPREPGFGRALGVTGPARSSRSASTPGGRRPAPGSRGPSGSASASPPASALGQAVCGSTQKAWGGV